MYQCNNIIYNPYSYISSSSPSPSYYILIYRYIYVIMDITHAIILRSHFCLRGKGVEVSMCVCVCVRESEWASERVGVFFNNFIMSNLIWVSSYISLALRVISLRSIFIYIFIFTRFKYLLP